jgi:hypothetical protein
MTLIDSRGAYTARALAGMLDSVGLLSRGNREQVHFPSAFISLSDLDPQGPICIPHLRVPAKLGCQVQGDLLHPCGHSITRRMVRE